MLFNWLRWRDGSVGKEQITFLKGPCAFLLYFSRSMSLPCYDEGDQLCLYSPDQNVKCILTFDQVAEPCRLVKVHRMAAIPLHFLSTGIALNSPS